MSRPEMRGDVAFVFPLAMAMSVAVSSFTFGQGTAPIFYDAIGGCSLAMGCVVLFLRFRP
jgi:hypothetical protein